MNGRHERTGGRGTARGIAWGAAAWALGAAVAHAGPLTPPAGPVQPTDTAITETDPRIEISALPFFITEPGSYVVTADLTATEGVVILASDVSLDLDGFTIRGAGAGSSHGVEVAPGLTNIVIQRGTITEWGLDGIHAPGASSGVVNQIIAESNLGDGMELGDGWTVTNSTIRDNGGRGLGGGNNGIVESSKALDNGQDGISLGDGAAVTNSAVSGNGGSGVQTGQGAAVAGVAASRNSGAGVAVGASSTVNDSVADNNSVGFSLLSGSTAQRCTARRGGLGFDAFGSGVQMVGCAAFEVDGDGFRIENGGVLRGSVAFGNGGVGVLAGDGVVVEQSNAAQNGIGIAAVGVGATVRNNTATQNSVGIRLSGASNLAIGNTASQSAIPFDFQQGNAWGEVLGVSGDGAFAPASAHVNIVY